MRFRTLIGSGLIALGCMSAGAIMFAEDGRRARMLELGLGLLGKPADAAHERAIDAVPPPRSVRVIQPQPSQTKALLSLSGRTAPAEEALISSRANGIVSERYVDIGDRVEAGQALLQISAPEIAQELERASAIVGQIEVRLELATLELDRAETLVTKGHVSAQTKDARYAAKKTAEADLIAARAEVKRLEEILAFQDVRAPFAGTVVERRVERGNKIVAAQSQDAGYLFRIARMNELRVEVDVPQSAALKISRGMPATVTFREMPRQTFSASVSRTAGLIDPDSATMRVELLMANADGIIPAGLNGEVVLELREEEGTVLVPNNTILTRDGRQMAAVVDAEERVRFRPIVISHDLGTQVAVSAGLDETDRVIASPNALLKEGDLVTTGTIALSEAAR